MEKESIEKIETKEEKMEKSEKPEWLKEVEGKLAGDSGLYQGLEKISELCTTESYKRGMQYFQEGAVDKIEYISRRVSEWQ